MDGKAKFIKSQLNAKWGGELNSRNLDGGNGPTPRKHAVGSQGVGGMARIGNKKECTRVWFSVAQKNSSTSNDGSARTAALLAVSESEVVMLDSADAAVGSAPINEIVTVTVHEALSGSSYEARLELTTRLATLVVWRDAAAREASRRWAFGVAAAPEEARGEEPDADEAAVASFLAALGIDPPQRASSSRRRFGLSSRVTTYTTRRGVDSWDASPAEERANEPQQEEEEEEDAEYERLCLRVEKRWGGDKPDVPRSLRRSARPPADEEQPTKGQQLAYRGSWLAPVDDTTGYMPSSPRSAEQRFFGGSPQGEQVASPKTTRVFRPRSIDLRRERYRDTLAKATESAARKAADVSRAALSVHADAERLGAQLSTEVSTAELESNLSLAADGAKEARARLAALEREVAMLAGPTLRELAWATQLRRTADARLARDLASEWPRRGWVVVKRLPGIEAPLWSRKFWLELVDTESGSRLSIKRSPDGDEGALFDLTLDTKVELRRSREPGAPNFALEVVPAKKSGGDDLPQNQSWYSAVTAYFFALGSDSSTNCAQHLAFAPHTADDQRCWSLAIDAVLRQASVAEAIALGDLRQEAEDAPQLAEPLRADEQQHAQEAEEDEDDEDDNEGAGMDSTACAEREVSDEYDSLFGDEPPDDRFGRTRQPAEDDADDEASATNTTLEVASVLSLDEAFAGDQQTNKPMSKLEAFKRSIASAVNDQGRSVPDSAYSSPFEESDGSEVPGKQKSTRRIHSSATFPPARTDPSAATVSQLSLLERESAARIEASNIVESRSLQAILKERPVAAAAPAASDKPTSRRSVAKERLGVWRQKLANDVNKLATTPRMTRSATLPPSKTAPCTNRPTTPKETEPMRQAPAPTSAESAPSQNSSVAALRRAYKPQPASSNSAPVRRHSASGLAAKRLSENRRLSSPSVVVVKRHLASTRRRGQSASSSVDDQSLFDASSSASAASEMIRELERGAIVAIRFLPRTEASSEHYEYECIDAFEYVDDETLAPLLQSHNRPTLAKLYSAWRSEFSVKTDQAEFRDRLKLFMASQSRRWLASCTLLEIERPDETCVVVVRLHDDPAEYVQPIKFGDVLICWSPKRDDGSMTFADRATATPVVVANLAKWLDANRVTAQRTLRIDTADANQDDHAPLNYDRVYRKLFQKAIVH